MVKDVVVLSNRESETKESLEQTGYKFHAVLTITQLLDYWESTGKVETDKIAQTRKLLQPPGDESPPELLVNPRRRL